MHKIEYKESPSPHVIIKNFLPETAARECLAEAQWLEPVYHPAHVLGGMNHSISSRGFWIDSRGDYN